jgi:hypothetical protein
VFDFLAFTYDKGTVTLMGYAYHGTLKHDATRAAKSALGLDQVIDKIEELPASQIDDELRWTTYYAIYRDPFLSRYAPGVAQLRVSTSWSSDRRISVSMETSSVRPPRA